MTTDALITASAIADRSHPPVSRASLRPAACPLAMGTLGAFLLAAGSPLWFAAAPGTWRVTIPGLPHDGDPIVAALTFLAGAGLLLFGWLGLVSVLRGGAIRARRGVVVALALALWWGPVLAGPPLLSNDVYAYVAQGAMAVRGIDPTAHGPIVLGADRTLLQSDAIWWKSPAPYGPVWIQASRAAVGAAGEDPVVSVWLIRALVTAGAVLAAVAVAALARRLGRDPALAVALAMANPLTVVHLVGGSHNDAWLLAFVVGGLAFLRSGRRGLGALALVLALGVKLTAVVPIVFVAWCWRREPASVMRRSTDVAIAVLASFAVVLGFGQVVGVGPGWITALRGTGTVLTTFAPVTLLGLVLGWATSGDEVRPVAMARAAGMMVAAAIGARTLAIATRLGPELGTGLVLLALFALGPVLWPWYLPCAIALLAVAAPLRWLPGASVLVGGALLTVWPTSVRAGIDLGSARPLLQLGAVGAVVTLAVVVQLRAERRSLLAHSADAEPALV